MASKSQTRYETFAREYVIDLNATRAAQAAGYKESTCNEQGSRLLANPKVRRIVDGLLSKRASKLELKAEHVVEELRRLAFSNMLDYLNIQDGEPRLDFSTLTRDQAAAIQEIKEDTTGGAGDGERKLVVRTTFRLSDKAKSLELLGRHLGMFQEKVEHTADDALLMALAAGRRRVTELP
jgi:phage terminase small subunit